MKKFMKNPIYSYISLCALSVLSVLSFAPHNITGFILLMILNLYFVLDTQIQNYKHPKTALYIVSLLYFIAQVNWIFISLYSIIQTGLVVASVGSILFAMVLSIFFFMACVIFVQCKTRNKYFDFILWLPALITMGEYIRGRMFTGFPWGDYSYTLVNNSMARGVFPLLGSYAVSFFLLSMVGLFYCMLVVSTNKIKLRLLFLITLCCAIFAYVNTIEYVTPFGKPLKTSLIQGDFTGQEKWSKQDVFNNLDVYKSMVSKAKGQLIIMPETAIVLFADDLPLGYWDSLVKLSQDKRATLITGMPKKIDAAGNYANVVMVVDESQNRYYAKQHLVPFGEYIPLRSILGNIYNGFNLPMVGFVTDPSHNSTINIGSEQLAVNICYENGFNDELIQNAKYSTIMLNISDMVWYGTSIAKDLHLELSQARAMENQRQVIQETNTGATALIDKDGSIISEMPSFQRGILEIEAQGYVGVTPFQRYGNSIMVGILSLIIAFGFIYWRFRQSMGYGQI